MSEWRIDRETVYRLYRDGCLITDEYGEPKNFASEEEAQHIAANWNLYRVPSIAQLRRMSDAELVQKHDLMAVFRGIFSGRRS